MFRECRGDFVKGIRDHPLRRELSPARDVSQVLLCSHMRFILALIGIMFALDALWWATSTRVAKPAAVRIALAAFSLAQLAGLAWLLTQRFSHAGSTALFPKFAVTVVFIWHMIILPLLLLLAIALLPILAVTAVVRIARRRHNPNSALAGASGALTRRQFLGVALATAPPLLNLSLATIAMRQLDQFRVRRFILPIADLPRNLHGLTIAQVSDMHVGRFTSGRVLRELVRVVNEFRADFVLLTGDLINDALADLDHGLELVASMKGRSGVYLIEGNHDLIENGAEFERRVKRSGIPFLLDESTVVIVRGAPVQLLGLSWTRVRENRDAAIAASVRRLITQRQPETFPILLAHHPHAFDAAAEASIPLTLSGHTHGGQLMLNEQCGFGPALFRYWSGLYTRGVSKLIVSNGVGNWFPLRVRAPAELVHLRLVRA
jgi:predicted MPP superfamily phosphohydrolase